MNVISVARNVDILNMNQFYSMEVIFSSWTYYYKTIRNNIVYFSPLSGNERDAHNLERLRELGITDILNVTSHIPFHYADQNINYKRLPASDSCHQKLSEFFDIAFDFIGT